MKQGRNLPALLKELQRQRNARKDFIADTRALELHTGNHGSNITVSLPDSTETFWLNELAHQQIAVRLQIPWKYYQKMRTEYPTLLDENINCWFSKNGDRRMIRTLDGSVRAFLSERYRRLDNLELVDAVFPVLKEMGNAEIISCEVTDTSLYIKVINKKLKAEIDVGDVIQAGLVISNSEVGLGSLKVEPLLYRLVCKNGLIVKEYAKKRYHVGKLIDNDDEAYEIYSDETLRADDKAFFMKIQDTVRCAVDETKFALSMQKFRDTKNESTGNDPIKTVEVLSDRYLLNQNERGSILRHFLLGNDPSRYGLINAVTRASQDVEDYNRATFVERLGGELLSLPICKQLTLPKSPMQNITPINSDLYRVI